MMELPKGDRKIYVFKVIGFLTESRPLIGWSGSFVSAVIRDNVIGGVDVSKLAVSPLFIGNSRKGVERAVLSGVNGFREVVDAGSRIWFTFSIVSKDFPNEIAEKLSSGVVGPFNVSELEFEVVSEFSSSLASNYFRYVDASGRGLVEVFFYPTIFVFHGWRVLYPSPQRLVFGLAKSAAELLGVNPKLAKKRARTLSRAIELVHNKTRVVSVDIGGNRVVKAFMGKAVYGVKGLENLRDFIDLLNFGGKINIGKSRGIGFGFYRFKILKR